MKPNWPTKKLGEICEIYQPQTITSKEIFKSGSYKVFGANGVIGYYSQYNHEKPEVIVGCRGTCGSVYFTEPKSWITGNAMVVHPKINDLLKTFLYYFLQVANLAKAITGTSQPQITRQTLSPIKIPLPPLKIQRKIVERLDAIKRAQELNDKQIELAEELFQSLLHRELDQKGKNWEIKKLGDLVEFLDNQRIPLNEEERTKRKGPYPYFGATGLMDWVDNFIFDGEFVLLAEDGGPFFEKDKPIAYRVSGKCWVNNHAHVLSPKDLINVDFLGYTLMFMDVTSYLTGSTRAKLNKTQAEKIKIPLPPIETQKKIVEKLSAVQEYKKKLLEQKQKLQELFESVLNKSMKGELI